MLQNFLREDTYFGWTFAVEFFSGVYHPQDTRDEKVSSVLPCGEYGEIEPLDPSGIHWIRGNSVEIPCKFQSYISWRDGLEFLHREGIVQRDIKPHNILVTGNHYPQLATVKIGDSGLSRCLDPDGNTSGMSTDAVTMMFKSPEFWQKDPQGRIRYYKYVDIFATGLTFLSMFQ